MYSESATKQALSLGETYAVYIYLESDVQLSLIRVVQHCEAESKLYLSRDCCPVFRRVESIHIIVG